MKAPSSNVSRAVSLTVLAARAAAAATLASACVPPGNSTPSDAGPAMSAAISPDRDKEKDLPSSGPVMTAVFEDTFDRKPFSGTGTSTDAGAVAGNVPGVVSGDASALGGGDAGHLGGRVRLADGSIAMREPDAFVSVFTVGDDGGGASDLAQAANEVGPDWTPTDPRAWHLEKGKLCGAHARNHGIWLNRVLPPNARIEFDAIADTQEGDLKGEFWGDGHSYATSLSYTNASGYLAILGGWKNTFHVLARRNEHGADRKEIKIDKTSDDPEEKPVEAGQMYRFKVERTDGKTVSFSVNGVEYLTYADPDPLKGNGHDHFGFNDWDAKVCFDNVKVTPL